MFIQNFNLSKILDFGVVLVLVLLLLVVTGGNKVNSYSNQLKLGQVCKLGVEIDKN